MVKHEGKLLLLIAALFGIYTIWTFGLAYGLLTILLFLIILTVTLAISGYYTT